MVTGHVLVPRCSFSAGGGCVGVEAILEVGGKEEGDHAAMLLRAYQLYEEYILDSIYHNQNSAS